MNQSHQGATSSDLSATTIPRGILTRLPDAFSKIKYAKLLASREVPYIGRAQGSLEEALGQIPDRECYVLFFEEASDARAENAMLLFNDLLLRGVPAIFVDQKLSGADYPVPAGQRLVRYIDGRVFDNNFARIPPSGVLYVFTKDWVIEDMPAAVLIRADPQKTNRRLNKDALKLLGKHMLWRGQKTDDSKVQRTDITDTKRSLALINRMNAQSVMGLFSRSCRLTCLLKERVCTLSWSVSAGRREVRIPVAALMDMVQLIKHFNRTCEVTLNVELFEIDFRGLCVCDARFHREVRPEFRALTRTLGKELTHIRLVEARSCEVCVRSAMRERKIFDQFGTDSYDRPLEQAPRMRSATSLAVELIRDNSRTLRTLEGVSEECTLYNLTVDSLSAQMCFERGATIFNQTGFDDCIVSLFATAGRELSIDIDRNVPRLRAEAIMQERTPSEVRVLKLRQSRVSGYYQNHSNFNHLAKVVNYAVQNCPRLEEVFMTFERLYEPAAATWRRIRNETHQEFASSAIASTEAMFGFYAKELSELKVPLTYYITFVTETPELPTSGIDHYTRTTQDDGSVVLERSEAFEHGGIGACIRRKGTV